MATINILVGQRVVLAALPTKGNISADLVGVPTWVATTPAKIGLEPSADGRTCEVIGKEAGTSVLTCSAQGAAPLAANHTISVAAVASDLATALSLTVQSPPNIQ